MSQRQQAQALIHVDEPHVRVTEYRLEPAAETGWRRRIADYVLAAHRTRSLAPSNEECPAEAGTHEVSAHPDPKAVLRTSVEAA
ncbi:MAG TPA: hypothetical protein VGL12_10975 [Roseiarcus sp.]